MFDHVTIRVADPEASARFYDTVLPALGIAPGVAGGGYVEWGEFSLGPAATGRPPTRRLHAGFRAPAREGVDAFWRAGTEAGYRSDGPPGPRTEYGPDYYGAFLLDPDGNSIEAVHDGEPRGAQIDHLWIRVADVGSARRFYEAVAPHTGFRFAEALAGPERARFEGPAASFSLVAGAPSENVHLAFPADDDATVAAFHAAATSAGYRDNGAPGERPEYHAGYYAAFALDPEGNNVELVNHNR